MTAIPLANRSAAVDQFIEALDHPLKTEIGELRVAILASNEGIAEHIKWMAPSFRFMCEDRVTFRLPPKGGLQLIFHRGAKVRDTADFVFEDNTGLMQWAAADRAIVTLRDSDEVATHTTALVALVNRWMASTGDQDKADWIRSVN